MRRRFAKLLSLLANLHQSWPTGGFAVLANSSQARKIAEALARVVETAARIQETASRNERLTLAVLERLAPQ